MSHGEEHQSEQDDGSVHFYGCCLKKEVNSKKKNVCFRVKEPKTEFLEQVAVMSSEDR